jgi:hypothetical protein
MPFNDKGEFIRAARRTASRPLPAAVDTRITRSDLILFAKALGGFVLLAAVVWIIAVFHEWIVMALILYLLAWLRSLFA